MLTLLELLSTFLLLAPITTLHHYSSAATTPVDPCREARSLEPLITVGLIDATGGFCPPTPNSSKQCCSAAAWTTLFPQSWTRLANPFNTKLVAMELGLRKGIEEVKGLNCPPGSTLQATTLSALEQLGTNKWIQLLNSTTSPECRLKVVQSVICPGTCDPNMAFKQPCRNLCLNTVRGCVGELATLATPWKHVMNNVRTAVRLLATTVNSGCGNPSSVDSLLHSLSNWREPLHWLDNGCQDFSHENCYNGRDVSSYKKGLAELGGSSNPEFPFSELPPGRNLTPEVQQFKTLIESVTQSFSHHWPKSPDSSGSPSSSSSDQVLSDEFGSGDGGDETSGRRFLITDDEDLLDSSEFGSGSGDGEGEEGDFGRFNPDGDDLLVSNSSESSRPTSKDPPPSPPLGAGDPPPSASSTLRPTSFFLIGATVLTVLQSCHWTLSSKS